LSVLREFWRFGTKPEIIGFSVRFRIDLTRFSNYITKLKPSLEGGQGKIGNQTVKNSQKKFKENLH